VKSRVSHVTGKKAVLPVPGRRSMRAGAIVSASIVVDHSSGAVLAVPVSALFTLPDGSTAVTVVHDGLRATVLVTAGSPIGGYVPVRPVHGRLLAGDRVLVGE